MGGLIAWIADPALSRRAHAKARETKDYGTVREEIDLFLAERL